VPGSQSINQLTKLARWTRKGSSIDRIGNSVLLVDQIGSRPGEFESRTSLIVVMVRRCGHMIYKAGYRLQTLNNWLSINEYNVLYRTPY
jgi:hypothetical protein